MLTALILTVVAVEVGVPVLLSGAVLLVAMVVLATAVVIWTRPGWVVDYTVTPAITEPGDPVDVTVELQRTRLSVLDVLDWSDDRERAAGARGARRLSYQLRLAERGRHPIGAVRVRVADPFGLVSRWTALPGGSSVIVLPQRVVLHGDPPRVAGRAHDDHAAQRTRTEGSGEPDVLTRPYRPGDAVKRVHWKATAHRGALMVRQEETPARRRWRLVVDTAAADDRELDWRICAAASALQHLDDDGVDVQLQLADQRFDRGQQSQEALVALALAEPRSHTPPPVDGGDPLLVFAGRLDDDQVRRWLLDRSQPAVVFAHALSAAASLDRLRAAGWTVCAYGDHDDVAQVWAGEDSGEAG